VRISSPRSLPYHPTAEALTSRIRSPWAATAVATVVVPTGAEKARFLPACRLGDLASVATPGAAGGRRRRHRRRPRVVSSRAGWSRRSPNPVRASRPTRLADVIAAGDRG
jgi:hypothetical protein